MPCHVRSNSPEDDWNLLLIPCTIHILFERLNFHMQVSR